MPPPSFRKEFPFIRPRLKITHFVPFYGVFKYLRDMDKIKGGNAPRIRDLFHLDSETLANWLTIGVSTWETPENPKESVESMKTAIQNSLFSGYHMVVTTLGVLEIVKHL